jgi:hypothetical protein
MLKGLDYVTGPPIAAMKADGVSFVCRYLSEVNALTQVKLLSANEAKTLGANGITIVSNYEWYGNRAAEGFASGVADAQIAASQHTACGGPPDRPIYFSVDFDTSVTPTIIDYFKGISSVIGLHRTGAYGSYQVIKGLLDANTITWGWQTYAWSGGAWEPRAHIQQYSNGVSFAGQSVDYNRSIKDDFGQWMPGGGEILLQLTDPMGKYFTASTAGDRWHCAKTNQDIAYALLVFYRQYGGVFGLPISGEIYLQQYPNVAIQYCQRALMVYDAKHSIDFPDGAGDCYLLHLDSGIGQQAVAKPLIAALQTQVNTLTAQVQSLTSELAALKAQPTPDTSALDAQIATLTTELAQYKQAIASTETALAALPK